MSNITEDIFFIGKSLVILSECGKVVKCPFEDRFSIFIQTQENSNSGYLSIINNSDNLNKFHSLIKQIFNWSNSTIMKLMLEENSLVSVLESAKKFYLMECGDFYTHLIDLADDFLNQEKNKVDFEKIDNIIDNATRSTSLNNVEFKDLFRFYYSKFIIRTEKKYLDKYSKILKLDDIFKVIISLNELNEDKSYIDFDDAKILESLCIDMKVEDNFLLNLIFSKKNLIKYKILFRQMLILKYEEKRLSETWILQQNFTQSNLPHYLKPSYLLRDKMLNFVKNLIYYFFMEVIEPNFQRLIEVVKKGQTFHEIISEHEKFLDNCIKECLMEDSEVLILISEIIQTCMVYSNIIIKFYNTTFLDEKLIRSHELYKGVKFDNVSRATGIFQRRKLIENEESRLVEEIFLERKFPQTVEKLEDSFSKRMEVFLEKINNLYGLLIHLGTLNRTLI